MYIFERKSDAERMVILLDIKNDDGNEETISVPARWVVCPRCDGKGSHWHEAFDNGIIASEMSEFCYHFTVYLLVRMVMEII